MSNETRKNEIKRLLEKFASDTTPILPPGVNVAIGEDTQKAIKAMLSHAEAGIKMGL